MVQMLCRNRVEDFDIWWKVFSSHAEAHRNAGLVLKDLWREDDDENNVFFLFDVNDVEKAKRFISEPEASEAGNDSGVRDGEIHFLNSSIMY